MPVPTPRKITLGTGLSRLSVRACPAMSRNDLGNCLPHDMSRFPVVELRERTGGRVIQLISAPPSIAPLVGLPAFLKCRNGHSSHKKGTLGALGLYAATSYTINAHAGAACTARAGLSHDT